MSKGKFIIGFVSGAIATIGALAATAYTYKKQAIDPAKKEAERIELNRVKANRKSYSAHQG